MNTGGSRAHIDFLLNKLEALEATVEADKIIDARNAVQAQLFTDWLTEKKMRQTRELYRSKGAA